MFRVDSWIGVTQRASLLRSRKRLALFHVAAMVDADGALVAGAIELCHVLKFMLGVSIVLIGAASDAVRAALVVDAVLVDNDAFLQHCHTRGVPLSECVAINVDTPPPSIGLALSLARGRDLIFVLPLLGFALDELHLRPRYQHNGEIRVAALTGESPSAVLSAVAAEFGSVDEVRCEQSVALVTLRDTPAPLQGRIGATAVAVRATLRERFAVTVLSSRVSFALLSSIVDAVEASAGAVRQVRVLSDDARDKWQCVELLVDWSPAPAAATRASLVALGQTNVPQSDVSVQHDTFARRHKRMVVFDMDSTLIQDECIDEMGKFANVGAQIEAITRRAMNGELDFSQSLRSRVALLKDQPNRIFQHVLDTMTYTPDAKLLCAALNRLGYTLAVLSGGFTNIIDQVKRDLELQHAHGNTLEVVDDKLTGAVLGEIVDARKKAVHLVAIARSEHIAVEQVIAIGDGANDLPMLHEAGLGVAFNAKPKVQEQAKFRINQHSMVPLAHLMGMRSSEVRQIAQV
jgi:phosphoserine phosphatase